MRNITVGTNVAGHESLRICSLRLISSLACGENRNRKKSNQDSHNFYSCGWRITLLYGKQRFTRQMDSGVILAPPDSLGRCGQINQEKDRPPEREPSDIAP